MEYHPIISMDHGCKIYRMLCNWWQWWDIEFVLFVWVFVFTVNLDISVAILGIR